MASKILLIEDDRDIVRVVRAYGECEGFVVEAALDGPGGLTKALTDPPALVILDWMLLGSSPSSPPPWARWGRFWRFLAALWARFWAASSP